MGMATSKQPTAAFQPESRAATQNKPSLMTFWFTRDAITKLGLGTRSTWLKK